MILLLLLLRVHVLQFDFTRVDRDHCTRIVSSKRVRMRRRWLLGHCRSIATAAAATILARARATVRLRTPIAVAAHCFILDTTCKVHT